MAVQVPSISCCVLKHHNLFYQIHNALAFNLDACCHLALCLRLVPFHLSFFPTTKIYFYFMNKKFYTPLMSVFFSFLFWQNFILFISLVLPSIGSNYNYAQHTVPLCSLFSADVSLIGKIFITLIANIGKCGVSSFFPLGAVYTFDKTGLILHLRAISNFKFCAKQLYEIYIYIYRTCYKVLMIYFQLF